MDEYLLPSSHHEAHSFNPIIAKELSIEKAIILKDLYGLCKYKLSNGLLTNNIPFCYYSSRAMAEKYPYMPASSIRRYLYELESDGYLISTVSNKMKIDVTKSYFVNFKMYDDLTLDKKWIDSEIENWRLWSAAQLIISIDQIEQPIDQSITMGDRNEQGCDRNEQAITFSTDIQQGEERSAIADPPRPPKLPEPLKAKKRQIDSDGLAAASRVVMYLNEKAIRNFEIGEKMSKSVRGFVVGRLNEGYTEEQLKKVVDNRCSSWLGDTKMSEFLRPKTLFNATNFVNYLEEATRSSGGTQNGPVYDTHLSNDREKAYQGFWEKTTETFPNIAKHVRFFTASEYLGFFADEPTFSPKIWSKYQGDMRKSKIRQALMALENDPQRNRIAPTGLCDYLKKWFIDERDGNH